MTEKTGHDQSDFSSQNAQVWQRQLIHGVLLSLMIVGPLVIAAASYYAYITQTGWLIPIYLATYGLLAVITFWKRVPYAAQVWAVLLIIYAMGALDFFQDGRGGSGRLLLLSVVTLTPLFFNRRVSVLVSIWVLITMIGLGVAFSVGWVRIPPDQEVRSADPFGWLSNTVVLAMVMALTLAAQWYLVPRLMTALEHSRRLAQDLAAQRADLERMVSERTDVLARRARYLEATSDVARQAGAVLDVHDLLGQVVNLISERFGFYHTGLFFVDSSGEWMVLQAASSAGGQNMLSRGHRLRIGAQGVVGMTAARGEPRIALDVGQDAVFFENPDLLDTRSEIALPLRSRGQVIGVLDVQSTEPGAFSHEDVGVLQTLADQVALAISNARLFAQAQESLEAQRRAFGEQSAQAWQSLVSERAGLGFVKQGNALLPMTEEWDEEARQAARTGQAARGQETSLAVPIKSGGRVVAVLDAHLPAESGGWTSEQVSLLQSLSEQAAQAMERARLYQDTQRAAMQERLVSQVTGRIRESLDMEAMLRTAVAEMRRALDLDDLVIRLTTPEMAQDGRLGVSGPKSG